MKQIVGSAWDEDGKRLHIVDWNSKFISAPKVDPDTQKAPIAPAAAISSAVGRTSGEVKALVALLGGTGLRVSEALTLRLGPDDGVGSFWDPTAATFTVRGTLVDGQIQNATKTRAGKRVVDLAPELNDFLKATVTSVEGRIFRMSHRTLRRRIEKLGIHGFHSMRRFRITHLQNESVPPMLVKFWAGHAAGDISERYTKFGEMVRERKDWSNKAGLGFSL